MIWAYRSAVRFRGLLCIQGLAGLTAAVSCRSSCIDGGFCGVRTPATMKSFSVVGRYLQKVFGQQVLESKSAPLAGVARLRISLHTDVPLRFYSHFEGTNARGDFPAELLE